MILPIAIKNAAKQPRLTRSRTTSTACRIHDVKDFRDRLIHIVNRDGSAAFDCCEVLVVQSASKRQPRRQASATASRAFRARVTISSKNIAKLDYCSSFRSSYGVFNRNECRDRMNKVENVGNLNFFSSEAVNMTSNDDPSVDRIASKST